MDMTLKEIQKNLGVSRRAVQGYEKAGLVAPTGRNRFGHLLYDEEACERIRRIKWYQNLGFTVKEIGEMIDAPENSIKPLLEQQLKIMLRKQKEFEELIAELEKEMNKEKI